MSGFLTFPWGILLLLGLSYGIWRGGYTNYLASLKLNSSWFLILVLALLLGSLWSPLLPLPGKRMYLNLGSFLALVLPACYWLIQGSWKQRLKGWAAALLIAAGLMLMHTEIPGLQRFLMLPQGLTLAAAALIASALTGKRSHAYGALILGVWLSYFYGAWASLYGFWEIGGIGDSNRILLALLLAEGLLWLRSRLLRFIHGKTPAHTLTNNPG